jgi:glycosyltransferase involved in cell wall biosynthesis
MAGVLHLYSDRKWTGAAEPVVNLCRELGSQFPVTLIHETHKKKPVVIARMAAEHGVPVATPLYLRKHHHLSQAFIDVGRLVSYIKKQSIQLLHVHRLGDHIVGGPAGWVTATPVLRTLYSEVANLNLREKLMLTRFTDGVIVPNEKAKANILRQLESFRARIWVVPAGIDTLRFNPERVSRESARRKLGISPDEYVLGIASRIRSSRKVGAAVEAFGIAQKKLAHLRLVIIGWGKRSNIEKCIREPVKRFGMEDRVLHLGYLKGESYVEALAAIDAGIYLAPGSDQTCRTILEFMAMSKPLIVGKQGILSGLVEDGENGFEAECNAEKVAEGIVHLGSDPSLAEKMGERSLARVREGFSLNLQGAAISKIYKSFLSAALFVESILPLDQACFIF